MSNRRCYNNGKQCDARLEALQAILARIEGVFDDPALERFGPLSTDTLADVTEIVNKALVADEHFDEEPCEDCGLPVPVDDSSDSLCSACYDKREQMSGGPA